MSLSFVWICNLSNLPTNVTFDAGDSLEITAGVHAIAQHAMCDYGEEEETMSAMFTPITEHVGGITNDHVSHLKFFLANVETFVEPVSVIPNVGGGPNECFLVKKRTDWVDDFIDWLEADHRQDVWDLDDEEDDDGLFNQTNYDENADDTSVDESASSEDLSESGEESETLSD